jgi:hypothetical protein
MGFEDLSYLLRLKQNMSLEDLTCVCDIGASQLYLVDQENYLELFMNRFKKRSASQLLSKNDLKKLANLGHAKKMWEHMGYDYICVDTSNEVETLGLDLNFDDVPERKRECSELVLNMGTTEHVANQIQAFKVIHDITAVGGLMYHNLPFQGYQTHGLVNYTPKFFWMLCRSNEYEFLDFSIQASKNTESIHPDILLSIEQTKNKWENFNFKTTTSGMRVLLRKKNSNGFVPPFDGHVRGTLNGIPEAYYEIYKK